MISGLLNMISVALLFAALFISVVSLGAIVRFFLLGKREPSTCFFFVYALCMLSVVLHSKPIPTWFRMVGIITVSITVTEMTAKIINFMCEKLSKGLGGAKLPLLGAKMIRTARDVRRKRLYTRV